MRKSLSLSPESVINEQINLVNVDFANKRIKDKWLQEFTKYVNNNFSKKSDVEQIAICLYIEKNQDFFNMKNLMITKKDLCNAKAARESKINRFTMKAKSILAMQGKINQSKKTILNNFINNIEKNIALLGINDLRISETEKEVLNTILQNFLILSHSKKQQKQAA